MKLSIVPKFRPPLDLDFAPAILWNRAYRQAVRDAAEAADLGIALAQDRSTARISTQLFPHREPWVQWNERYAERLLKFLLWQKGGHTVYVAGEPGIAEHLQALYSPGGARSFDWEYMGERIYGKPFTVESVRLEELPEAREPTRSLGGHLDGCRIGFDLGGSDRKSAALIDGKVVFSEEIEWDPYFQPDPAWHYREINDSLKRAAARLPRVDAIGGSAAGVYVDNEVRVASLFRGVSKEDFDQRIRTLFLDLKREWGVPFEVVNDGEVTALAGAMALGSGAVLGIAMGTSLAAGYIRPDGRLTDGLNELAFVPFDYRPDAPADEWSGDLGVGAQYFSQQAVARLAPAAGMDFDPEIPFAERLVQVQQLMAEGDARAEKIYRSIGTYFGYAIAQLDECYEIRHMLALGRVLTGDGGDLILQQARQVLREEFPDLEERVSLRTPGEKEKRHGQAVAAASLPEL